MTARPSDAGRVVVIGLGNPWRRDDGVGHAVAERVRSRLDPAAGVEVVLLDGEPAGLLAAWRGARRAVVVDAVVGSGPPGTVAVVDPEARTVGAGSTHALGLADAVALGRYLGWRPDELVVIGIIGADFSDGPGLTPSVEAALDPAAELVLAAIEGPDG